MLDASIIFQYLRKGVNFQYPYSEKIHDYLGGIEDIKKSKVRCFIFVFVRHHPFFCAHFAILFSFHQVRTAIPAGTLFQEDCGWYLKFNHFFDYNSVFLSHHCHKYNHALTARISSSSIYREEYSWKLTICLPMDQLKLL